MPFFIIFIAIPIIEVMIFLEVGDAIGLPTTLLLALATAIIGGFLVKHQGFQVLREIQIALQRGHVPLNELFDGMCLIAAGVLLITPGFLSDTLGFLLLIPYVRNGLRYIIRRHTRWAAEASTGSAGQSYQNGPYKQTPPPGEIIEGEYERVDDTRE
jgi:UPF0716 protein FxsA